VRALERHQRPLHRAPDLPRVSRTSGWKTSSTRFFGLTDGSTCPSRPSAPRRADRVQRAGLPARSSRVGPSSAAMAGGSPAGLVSDDDLALLPPRPLTSRGCLLGRGTALTDAAVYEQLPPPRPVDVLSRKGGASTLSAIPTAAASAGRRPDSGAPRCCSTSASASSTPGSTVMSSGTSGSGRRRRRSARWRPGSSELVQGRRAAPRHRHRGGRVA
jgi:hypothetical protein